MRIHFQNLPPIDWRKEIAFYFGLFVALLFLFSIEVSCKTYAVSVVKVYDGDSLRLKFENDFEFDARLHGIDAPEPTQLAGDYCKEQLENRVSVGAWKVQFIAEDAYNRKLVQMFRADYSTINFELVQIGCAFVYSPPRKEKKKYQAAFAAAFAAQTGAFSIGKFCEPSKFRRGTCTE